MLISPRLIVPMAWRSVRMYSVAPSILLISGRLNSHRVRHIAANITTTSGQVSCPQVTKLRLTPTCSSRKPRPTMLAVDPMGVSSPPTLAP